MPGFASGYDAIKSIYAFFRADKNIFNRLRYLRKCLGLPSGKPDKDQPMTSPICFSPKEPPMPKPSNGKLPKKSELFFLRSSKIPPWTMPKSACSFFLFCDQTLLRPSVSFCKDFCCNRNHAKEKCIRQKQKLYPPQVFLNFYGTFWIKLVFLSHHKKKTTPSRPILTGFLLR